MVYQSHITFLKRKRIMQMNSKPNMMLKSLLIKELKKDLLSKKENSN
jgi:hypothetical protein